MSSSLKTCFKCGETKPRSEFYAHPRMADGLLGKCKDCTKRDATSRRWKKIKEVRKYDNSRAMLPHRAAARNAHNAVMRNTKLGRLKARAHRILNRAVAAGKIVREPCKVCGKKKVEAHHHDYTKPLDVTWVCTVHHRQLHHGYIIL